MDTSRFSEYMQSGKALAISLAIAVVSALALWIVGRWIIGFVSRLIGRSMSKQKVDPTVIRYIQNAVAALLNIVLVILILGFFGVQTTSLAALIAAAGVAIGVAWSGLLANFAAGIFVVAGGVTGTVEEVGLFVTSINTLDNIRNIVGNGKIFGDIIQNFSHNPYRRVDLQAQLDHSVDVHATIAALKANLARIPNVLAEPAPDVEILTFTLAGPVLAVRPYCSNAHYWQVYFDTNRVIRDTGASAGLPAPEQHFAVRTSAATQ